MVSPLVLWDRAQHLPQPLQALPRVARLTERGLYGLVLRREVGRHDVSARAPEAEAKSRKRAAPRRRARVVPWTDPPVLKVWLDATPGARGPRVRRGLAEAGGTRPCCRLPLC